MSDAALQAPATSDAAAVLDWLESVAESVDAEAAARALGDALLAEGQSFLAAVSTEDDVELFFETFGYSSSEGAAQLVARIIRGLAGRFPADTPGLVARAGERALARLSASRA